MDKTLKEKHFSIMAKGKVARKKYVKKLGIAIFFFVVTLFGAIYSASFSAPGWLVIGFVIAFVPALLFLLLYGYRVVPKIINPLDSLDRAFESVYSGLITYDDAPNFQDPHVQQDISIILQSAYFSVVEPKAIDRLLEESSDLIDRTHDNIKKRLLPAAREGKISKQTVVELAKILSAPSVDVLRTFNSEVETSYVEQEKAGIPLRREVSKFLRTKGGKLTSSLTLGFGIVIAISILYAVAVGQDVLTFFKNNPVLVLGSGFGLTVGLLALLRE